MPTILSAGNNLDRELWTSDEFLDWLEPGVVADLIDGDGVQEYWILDPETLVHRFFHREASFFIEFAAGEPRISSKAIPGFWVDRTWLVSESPPQVLECLRQVLPTSQE
jgi:hypothetical protein